MSVERPFPREAIVMIASLFASAGSGFKPANPNASGANTSDHRRPIELIERRPEAVALHEEPTHRALGWR